RRRTGEVGHRLAQPAVPGTTTLRRRRRSTRTSMTTTVTAPTAASTGTTIARIDRTTDDASSTVETTGAATPSVAALSTGRTADLRRWTASATPTPRTTAHQLVPLHVPLSTTCSPAVPAPTTSPP